MSDTTVPVRVAQGLAQGATMNVIGTPVVFLNGWRYPGTPSKEEFLEAVDALLDGRKPNDEFPASALPLKRAP